MIERTVKDLTSNTKNLQKIISWKWNEKKNISYILRVPSPLQLPFFLALQLVQMLKVWNQQQENECRIQ